MSQRNFEDLGHHLTVLETLHVTPEHLQGDRGGQGGVQSPQKLPHGGSEAESQACCQNGKHCMRIISASQRAALNDFLRVEVKKKIEDFLLTQIRRRRYGVAPGIILCSHPKMWWELLKRQPEDSCA